MNGFNLIAGLPTEALVAIWTAAVGAVGWFGRSFFQAMMSGSAREARLHEQGWQRARTLEEQINQERIEYEQALGALRKVIDNSRRRENAAMTALELALFGYDLDATERPALFARIREILERAAANSKG